MAHNDDLIIDFNELEKLGDSESLRAVFRAPSKTRTGMFHYQFVYNDNRGIRCTCEGFKHHGRCWHINKIPGEVLSTIGYGGLEEMTDDYEPPERELPGDEP